MYNINERKKKEVIKMKVFIIKNDDTGECHVFQKRENAIDTMYRKCKEWGAILYSMIYIRGSYQYVPFDDIYETVEQKLNFLYHCSNGELNELFETYWSFQECEIEDYTEVKQTAEEYMSAYNKGFADGQEYAENNPPIRPNY